LSVTSFGNQSQHFIASDIISSPVMSFGRLSH
jgi:hypothetical protein